MMKENYNAMLKVYKGVNINIQLLKEKFAASLIAVATLLKEDVTNHLSKHLRMKFRLLIGMMKEDYIEYKNQNILMEYHLVQFYIIYQKII